MPPRTPSKGVHNLEVRDAARLSLVLGVMYPTFNNVPHGGVDVHIRCALPRRRAPERAKEGGLLGVR